MTRNLQFKQIELPNGYLFVSKRKSRYAPFFIKLNRAVLGCAIAWMFKDLKPLKIRYYLYILASIILEISLTKCTIVEERLMMLSNFGLQMEYINLYGNKTVRSLPINSVKDLLINEGFVMNEIIFYILILLKDSEEIILPFKDAIPRLENLKTIYRCFNSLFERG